jgi:hypothetical protein
MQALIDQDLQDLLLPTYIAKRPTRAVPQSSKKKKKLTFQRVFGKANSHAAAPAAASRILLASVPGSTSSIGVCRSND